MKLTETIDHCIDIIERSCSHYKTCIETLPKEFKGWWVEEDVPKMIEEYQNEIKECEGHLKNLKYIQCETNLESWEVDEEEE